MHPNSTLFSKIKSNFYWSISYVLHLYNNILNYYNYPKALKEIEAQGD
jgi:hypothetical protein